MPRTSTLVTQSLRVVDIVSIDPYILSLVVPWQVQLSLSRWQCLYRLRLRERMANKSTLECLVKQAFRKEYLLTVSGGNDRREVQAPFT